MFEGSMFHVYVMFSLIFALAKCGRVSILSGLAAYGIESLPLCGFYLINYVFCFNSV